MTTPRIAKTCDICKSRKVRCIKLNDSDKNCTNCVKRGEACQFSNLKKRRRRNEIRKALVEGLEDGYSISTDAHLQSIPQSQHSANDPFDHEISPGPMNQNGIQQKFYIDWLVESRQATGGRQNNHMILKRNERYVNSSSIAFFSESRVRSLSERLGHDRVQQLLDDLELVIRGRLSGTAVPSGATVTLQVPRSPAPDPSQLARSYIKSYFDQLHPVYPFLDQEKFEAQAFSPELSQLLKKDKPWAALYFTVLALGSQYHDEGTFDPGKGKPWKYFQVALGSLSELLVSAGRLINAQALAAMAIFALNFSCLQLEKPLATEAARMAVVKDLNKNLTDPEAQRTFWVIYGLEKEYCFLYGNASMIADYDIGCPVPRIPEAMFGDLDWPLVHARYSRILSKAYESLFSISATLNSQTSYFEKIDAVRYELDSWKDSLPLNFRPGHPLRLQDNEKPASKLLALTISYSYYHTLIALSRLTLHVATGKYSDRLSAAKSTLMQTARSIIDLTQHIDLGPHTPTLILGHLPLAALFILFDFVIHNPNHVETRKNLAYLDIAAGHFSRLEFATDGSLPSSLLAEFTHVARQYVQHNQSRVGIGARIDSCPESHDGTPGPVITPDSGTTQPVFDQSLSETSPSSSLLYPNPEEANNMAENLGLDVANLFGSGFPDFLDPGLAYSIDSMVFQT